MVQARLWAERRARANLRRDVFCAVQEANAKEPDLDRLVADLLTQEEQRAQMSAGTRAALEVSRRRAELHAAGLPWRNACRS